MALSENECAFGANVNYHCKASVKAGDLNNAGLCKDTWNTFIDECGGKAGLIKSGCTKGRDWQDVSYAICEKMANNYNCVAYVSGKDAAAILENKENVDLLVFAATMDLCAAVLGPGAPYVGAACGVAKIIADSVAKVVDQIKKDAINAALDGSAKHGEAGGIQLVMNMSICTTAAYEGAVEAVCDPKYPYAKSTTYKPL